MNTATISIPARRGAKPKGPHPDKRLSAAFVRSARPGRHADGNGLYLHVQASGARSWIQRLVIHGRRAELGLGSAVRVPLDEARDHALANRRLARAGGDPLARKRRAGRVPEFADAAVTVIEQKRGGWRSPKLARDWLRSLERHAFPRIGGMPVSEVSGADVIAMLAPIWQSKPQTARTVRHRVRAVLEWAIAMEWRTDNPCDGVVPVLGSQNPVVERRLALPHREVASAIETVRASTAADIVKRTFEFLVLTASRYGEVRGAVWAEMDTANRVWTVPAKRMKTNRAHRVPLCGRALEIVDSAGRAPRGDAALVFPNERGARLDEKRLRRALRKYRIAAVPHGFRSSFRDWAAEETDHPREVIEAALAHVVPNAVEAAYRRSDLFERRRRLMDDWAAYLAGKHRTPVEA